MSLYPWRPGQGDGVPGDVATLGRLAEGGPRGPVHLVCGPGPEARSDHLRVEPLEVLRLDPVDPMLAETRHEVPVDGSAIANVGLVPH